MLKQKSLNIEKPLWLKYSEEEVMNLILKLSEKGFTSEKIGLVLRDQYGIPRVKLFGFKIKDVLKDKFKEPTIINVEKKVVKLEAHVGKHKKDKKADRSLIITKAKLKKRENYHNR
ncbi:hypothetical protein J4221_06970 [Candidatus Pacearchaeota archaeon]|nr:hypothetical protein [Candidatus Pacearchaeota archaeon]